MIALLHTFRDTRRPSRPVRRRRPAMAVEGLDQRALLSAGMGSAVANHVAEVRSERDSEHNGMVVKTPRFYEDYTGPRLAQLDVVKATGQLQHDGSFRFVGVNQGVIDPNVTATYVFGIDRSGRLPTGPFPGRPDIRFDATVAIKVVPGKSPTATVTDLANHTSTALPASAFHIAGKQVEVTVPGSLLPSTGLHPSQYRYDLWPADGLPGSTNIASFAPEFHDIRVGVTRGG